MVDDAFLARVLQANGGNEYEIYGLNKPLPCFSTNDVFDKKNRHSSTWAKTLGPTATTYDTDSL